MNPADRAAIRARADAATPGPWILDHHTVKGGDELEGVGLIIEPADREFVMHARTDIPLLLDALTAAEAERDEARAEQRNDDEYLGAEIDRVEAMNVTLRQERDAARAEVASMRPVVEAAKAWQAAGPIGGVRLLGALFATVDALGRSADDH